MPFSMSSIKTYVYNKFLNETIFSNLGLDMSSNKIKTLYNQCLNIGRMNALINNGVLLYEIF